MRVEYLEVRGFRSYGPEPQRLDLTAPLAVVHADNGQGKSSLAEAVEFLLTGATSRRLLLGGSPGEFQGALRNVHLAAGEPVWVEMGLSTGGQLRVLRRELTCDYRGASDCTSVLTLDGAAIHTAAEAGLVLSDPPLAAPVLLEHSLRYAVAAKPGDRADYFKAVLEVSDLDTVRTEIDALLAERARMPQDPLLAALGQAAAVPLFTGALDPLRREHGPEAVRDALRDACHAAARPDGPDTAAEPLAVAATRLRGALENRQRDVFPLAELLPPPPAAGPTHPLPTADPAEPLESAVASYDGLATAVDRAAAAVLPLLRAALQVDAVTAADGEHPADCPLCQTPQALTAARVTAIRAQLDDQQQLSTAAAALREEIRATAARAQSIASAIARTVPTAARWDQAVRARHAAAAERLGAVPGQAQAALAAADELATAAAGATAGRSRCQRALDTLAAHVERLEPIPSAATAEASTALHELAAKAANARAVHLSAHESVEALAARMRPALEQGSDTAGWATVARLADSPAEVADALAAHARRSAATARLRQAATEVDAAVQSVLDRRLERMGGEVRRWWTLLRPSELATFDAITRRGTGRRYLDVTAALTTGPTSPGVIRNALAVLSNSQLNALGLAAFLARCQLLDTPLVVLDDPVPSSDREHRNTFASSAVAALLDDGRQVLVTTHDAELARHLHISHQHRGVDEFEAVLVEAAAGTQVVRSSDDFERCMLDAHSQMHSPLTANRRAAGNSLRIAAERLAKHVAAAGRRRAGDTAASVGDLDGRNLKDLRVAATQHALGPDEPGQWQQLALILNDADHDTEPPTSSDLVHCHGLLRRLRKNHGAHDPRLMRR